MEGDPGSHVFPSAVVLGSFIKTFMTCSHTGGIEGGSGGVIKEGMLEGELATMTVTKTNVTISLTQPNNVSLDCQVFRLPF